MIYDPDSTGTKAYLKLAKEIIQRDENVQLNDAKNNIDKNGEGTAEFISKAIEIYCRY